jgi:hypothetical protein
LAIKPHPITGPTIKPIKINLVLGFRMGFFFFLKKKFTIINKNETMEITIIESFKNDLRLLMKTYLSEINFSSKKNNLEKKISNFGNKMKKRTKKKKKRVFTIKTFFNEIDCIYII